MKTCSCHVFIIIALFKKGKKPSPFRSVWLQDLFFPISSSTKSAQDSEFRKTKCCSKLKTTFCSYWKTHWAPAFTVPSDPRKSRNPAVGGAETGIQESAHDIPLMRLISNFPLVIYSCPGTQGSDSPGKKCHGPAFALHARYLSSETAFALFCLLLLLAQPRSRLDWRRHCRGFGELRSGSAQVETEFPAVTFITVIVMKHWLFSLFFWQSSAGVAEVCRSALISVISRRP